MICIKRFFKTILLVLMCVITFGSSHVYAREDVDSVVYTAVNMAEITAICSRANAVAGVEILTYSGDDGLLSFSNKNYSTLDLETKKEFMEVALLTTKESSMGSQIKNKVYNFIASQDTTTSAALKFLRSDASTDFVSAAAWFKHISGPAGTLLGLLALGIFLFIGLSILFDIAYLSLPLFKVINESDRKKRPRFVSREAYSAAIDAENSIGSDDYQSSVGLYLKRRIPAIILISIAVGYLVSGQIYDLIGWFVDSFSFMFK